MDGTETKSEDPARHSLVVVSLLILHGRGLLFLTIRRRRGDGTCCVRN